MIFSVFQKNCVFWYSWSTRKQRFPMDKRPLVEGRITIFGIFLDVFEFLRFRWFFSFFQKYWVLGYCWFILLWYRCYYIRNGREMLCLPYAGFLLNTNIPFVSVRPWHPRKPWSLAIGRCWGFLDATYKFLEGIPIQPSPREQKVLLQLPHKASDVLGFPGRRRSTVSGLYR